MEEPKRLKWQRAAISAAIAFLLGTILAQTFSNLSPLQFILAGTAVGIGVYFGLELRSNKNAPLSFEPTMQQTNSWDDNRCGLLEVSLAKVADLLQSHLVDNLRYVENLLRTNARLQTMQTTHDVQATVRALIEENNKIQMRIASLSEGLETSRKEISQLRMEVAVAEEAGTHDPLTLLGNRRMLDAFIRSQNHASEADSAPTAIVLIDLDQFKGVNDKFGHMIGDALLKLFAQLLSSTIKVSDRAIRFGGDEFALVLPNTTLEKAGKIAEGIRSNLESKRWVAGMNNQPLGKITASFGVATFRTGENVDAAIERADALLYRAKAAGRNKVEFDLAS